MPQLYLGVYYITCFIFELPGFYYDLRLPFSLYFCWFYLRFLMPMPNSSDDLGDASDSFALFTFFPYSLRPQVASLSYQMFTVINESTGAFDYIKRRFGSPL